MEDPVHRGFLEKQVLMGKYVNENSDSVRVTQDPSSGTPPEMYNGVLIGAEHYVRENGVIQVTKRPLPFRIRMESDYCKSLDPHLQMRVIRTSSELYHPNVHGGSVCLGPKFRPATSLRVLVEQFYRIATGRVAATNDPFDPEASEYFLDHIDQVRAFENPPLWRSPVASRVRVETISNPPGDAPNGGAA
jgi:hypothetical protein